MPLALHIPVFSMNLGFHHLPTDFEALNSHREIGSPMPLCDQT